MFSLADLKQQLELTNVSSLYKKNQKMSVFRAREDGS